MKSYGVSSHAIDQLLDRFGISRSQGRSHIVNLMQTAVYQGATGTGRVFDHYTTRTRLIVARDTDKVITVYSMDTDKDGNPIDRAVSPNISVFADVVSSTIRREFAKARRSFTTTYRKLTEDLALLHIEIGRLTLNKVRCKHPGTQAIIQRRIDAKQTKYDALHEQLTSAQAEYNRAKTEARAIIGTEVSV